MEQKNLVPLTSHQIGAKRAAIEKFVRDYPAGAHLLELGMRGGQITPIVSRKDNSVIVSVETIKSYCDFIREYGYAYPKDLLNACFGGRQLYTPPEMTQA